MKTERFEMRLHRETLERVDKWRAEQPDLPSRAEAMRRLADVGLTGSGQGELRISDGEKLILVLLLDLYRHQKVKTDIDLEFVSEAISGGHYWALKLQYPGLMHGHVDSGPVVSEVTRILSMWDSIERDYAKLSQTDKDRVQTEADPFGDRVMFWGFYANEEADHLSVADFLINHMKRFTRFNGRELDSHMPTVDAYRRMHAAFTTRVLSDFGGELTAAQIIDLLKQQVHPDNR